MKKSKKKLPNDSSLKSNYNSKVRQEFLDYDYLNKLSKEEYDWLAAFTHEDNCANLNHNGDKVFDRDKKTTKKLYDKNNARNRDAFGVSHAHKRLMYMEQTDLSFLDDNEARSRNPEDHLIDMIDIKNSEYKMDLVKTEFNKGKRRIEKRDAGVAMRKKNKSSR
jgi:hypothetical protein